MCQVLMCQRCLLHPQHINTLTHQHISIPYFVRDIPEDWMRHQWRSAE
jgi:hypothetical protein